MIGKQMEVEINLQRILISAIIGAIGAIISVSNNSSMVLRCIVTKSPPPFSSTVGTDRLLFQTLRRSFCNLHIEWKVRSIFCLFSPASKMEFYTSMTISINYWI